MDPNYANCFGQTALFYAASNGKLSLAKILIEEGKASPNQYALPSKELKPVFLKDDDILMKLKKQAISYCIAPIHICCAKGNEELLKYLLSKGAFVSVQGKQNCTALHIAAMCGEISIAKILISNKVDTESKNLKKKTALDIITQYYPKNFPELDLMIKAKDEILINPNEESNEEEKPGNVSLTNIPDIGTLPGNCDKGVAEIYGNKIAAGTQHQIYCSPHKLRNQM